MDSEHLWEVDMLYSHPSRAHPVTANSITVHEIDFALTTSRKLLKAFRKCRRLFVSVLLLVKISGRFTLLLIYQNVSDECKERGLVYYDFYYRVFPRRATDKNRSSSDKLQAAKEYRGGGENKRRKKRARIRFVLDGLCVACVLGP